MIITGFLHTIQEIEINVSQVTLSQPLLIYIWVAFIVYVPPEWALCVLVVSIVPLLRLFDWILKLFRQSGIVVSFLNLFI
jgi:hypothetical protein